MKKLSKILAAALAVTVMVSGFAGCSAKDDNTAQDNTQQTARTEETATEGVDINMAVLKGPTGIGAVKLMTDNKNGESFNRYTFAVAGAPDEVTAGLISGEYDVAAVASNLASVLYNKTEGQVEIAAINTLGVLYVVEVGDTIHSIEDLNGVDIVSSGQGATPEYVTDFIFDKLGVTPASIEYRSEHSELAAEVAAGDVKVAILPEPHVTSVLLKNPDARVALSLTDEWSKAVEGTDYEGSELTMGCIVARKEFVENNKEAFDKFLEEYAASINYVNNNIEDASDMVEEFGVMPSAAAAAKAIPNCNIVYIDGDEMKATIEPFYKVLFEANPKSIGGALPDENFYYKK